MLAMAKVAIAATSAITLMPDAYYCMLGSSALNILTVVKELIYTRD
jgi:hypothetical protein